jgi:hypothetical protein
LDEEGGGDTRLDEEASHHLHKKDEKGSCRTTARRMRREEVTRRADLRAAPMRGVARQRSAVAEDGGGRAISKNPPKP